jgi:hypothetical protein
MTTQKYQQKDEGGLMTREEYEALLREERDLLGADVVDRARLVVVQERLSQVAGPEEARVRALLGVTAKTPAPKPSLVGVPDTSTKEAHPEAEEH